MKGSFDIRSGLHHDLPAVYLRHPDAALLKDFGRAAAARVQRGGRVLILTSCPDLYHGCGHIEGVSIDRFCWRGARLNHSRTAYPRGLKERALDLVLLRVRGVRELENVE